MRLRLEHLDSLPEDALAVLAGVQLAADVCTHTARRSGATLMYLDGMPIYDIMKVTGHKSVTTLEKYIRADKLEVAQKLARKNYQYFK